MPMDWGPIIGAGIGAAGGILQGIGQGKQADANREQQAAFTRAQVLQRFLEAQQGDTRSRATAGLEATQLDPLKQQRSRQQQALMAAILPGLRNFSVTAPNDQIAAKMPGMSGGFRIPEGGFGADTQAFFSPSARANAESGFAQSAANVNPYVPPPNFNSLGYGAAGDAPTATARSFQQQSLADLLKQQTTQQDALMRALQEDKAAETHSSLQSQDTPFWKKLLGIGGAIAAPFTGGATLGLLPMAFGK